MIRRRKKGQYHSNTSFLDLLFNTLVGFVMLFIIAFLLISPIKKKKEIEQKAEYVVTVVWPNEHTDDVDTWLEDPAEKLMSFRNKEIGLLHLDRDDLGSRNDRVKQPDGTIKYISMNFFNISTFQIITLICGLYYFSFYLNSNDKVKNLAYSDNELELLKHEVNLPICKLKGLKITSSNTYEKLNLILVIYS